LSRVEISFRQERCEHPEQCLLCIQACPYRIIGYKQAAMPAPGKAPAKYILVAVFRILCTLCNRCVRACPREAIELDVPEW
jgi:ferredoxin